MNQENIIKTISYSQTEILWWIIDLYCPGGFDLDPTYSKGVFYKDVPEPNIKMDLNPQTKDTLQADATIIPLKNESINSINFDPPFIATTPSEYKKKYTMSKSKILNRFGYAKHVDPDLWDFYKVFLCEAYRVLKSGGFLIFKCQDTIESGIQYFSHVVILNMAVQNGFYPKDLFVLLAKNRMIGPHHWKQKHARKYHSYFWVFQKKEFKKPDYSLVNRQHKTLELEEWRKKE
jgi:methylase of polypeptide subunit release factors